MVARELRSPDEAEKEIENIQAELSKKGEKALLDLRPLTINDCSVIGLVIVDAGPLPESDCFRDRMQTNRMIG